MQTIPDNLTERARRAIYYASYEARNTGSTEILVFHLLLGCLREQSRITASLIREFNTLYKPAATSESNSYLAEWEAYKKETDEDEYSTATSPPEPVLCEELQNKISNLSTSSRFVELDTILIALLK